MASLFIAKIMNAAISGVGATAVYAKLQQAPPVSTNVQISVGGTSALISTIALIENTPRMPFSRALTLSTFLSGTFYCIGGAIGAGLSAHTNSDKSPRHEDV
jgi:hypothetical protein